MAKDLWDVALFFLTTGILGFLGMVLFKMGKMKPVFLPLPVNPEIPVSWSYAGLPIGVGSLVSCFGLMWNNRGLFMLGLAGMIICGLVFMIWKPRWLKPDWLLWLEENYDQQMLDFMFEQARQDKHWSQKVATREGLEAWAKEMERKHRSYIGDGYG